MWTARELPKALRAAKPVPVVTSASAREGAALQRVLDGEEVFAGIWILRLKPVQRYELRSTVGEEIREDNLLVRLGRAVRLERYIQQARPAESLFDLRLMVVHVLERIYAARLCGRLYDVCGVIARLKADEDVCHVR